jgi:hypothetical protein
VPAWPPPMTITPYSVPKRMTLNLLGFAQGAYSKRLVAKVPGPAVLAVGKAGLTTGDFR